MTYKNSLFVIGKRIEQEMHAKNISASELADRVGICRSNLYHVFTRESIDTDLLYRFSDALGVDFFRCYSESLKQQIPKAAG